MFAWNDKGMDTEKEKEKEPTKSFIAAGVELEADILRSSGNIAINGLYKGILEVAKTTELLCEGAVIGDIKSCDAVISGNVKGTISCTGFLEITQTANIEGDISASSIEVEHGATISGNVRVNSQQINERGLVEKSRAYIGTASEREGYNTV